MSSLSISDLPFLYDMRQTDNQVLKIPGATEIQGGQNLLDSVEDISKELEDTLEFLADEAAQGPMRLENRLSGISQLL